MNFIGKTPVSALQELMASRGLPLPKYYEEDVFDRSLNTFKCTANAGGVTAVGFGSTKKAAKHESARNALRMLNGTSPAKVIVINHQQSPKNYVGDLNEYSSKNGFTYPEYDLIPGASGGNYIYKCRFLGKDVLGRGASKKDAKQDAAKNMLMWVGTNHFKVVNSKTIKTTDMDEIIAMYETLKPTTSYSSQQTFILISAIDYLNKKLEGSGIEYTTTEIQTKPYYILSLTVKGSSHNFLETGDTKEDALKKALEKILLMKESGHLFNDLITL